MSNSKLSVRVLRGLTCEQIYHPGETCTQMLVSITKTGFPICAAALAPLMLIPPILRRRSKMTKSDARKSVWKWLSVSMCLYLNSNLAQLLMCIMTNAFGRVYVWTFWYWPVALGSLVTFVMPSGDLAAFELANTMSGICLEAIFRHFDGIFSYAAVRTLIFMCVSAVLMDATRMNKMHGAWWILQPASTRHALSSGSASIPSPVIDHIVGTDFHVCSHAGSCDRFIFDGIKTYFSIYMALDASRILIAHGAAIMNSPTSLPKVILKNWNGKLMTFIVGYATMYRLFSCLMNRRSKKESRLTIALSSFWSASAFYFYPNYTLLAQGSATAFRVLWHNLGEMCPLINVFSQKFPISKTIYFFTSGMMFHLRAFHPYLCQSGGMKATDYISSYRCGRAVEHFTKLYLGYS